MESRTRPLHHILYAAQFFYEQMVKARGIPDQVGFLCSAFLSAGHQLRRYAAHLAAADPALTTALTTWWSQLSRSEQVLVTYFQQAQGRDAVCSALALLPQDRRRHTGRVAVLVDEALYLLTEHDEEDIIHAETSIHKSYVFDNYPDGTLKLYSGCYEYLLLLDHYVAVVDQHRAEP